MKLSELNQKLLKETPLKRKKKTHVSIIKDYKNNLLGHSDKSKQNKDNRQSTVSQPSAKPSVNRRPTVSQPSVESLSNGLPNKPTVSQPSAKPLVQSSVNRQPTVSQPSVEINIDSLTGKKLKFLNFIFNQCKISSSLSGMHETHPITNDVFQNELDISTTGGIRSLIWELKKDGFLNYISLKKGKVGLRKYILPKEIFQKFVLRETVSQPSANRQSTVGQTVSAIVSQPSAKPSVVGPSSSISSSNYINTNTTNLGISERNDQLSSEWNIIQTPELLKEKGFGKSHILSIKNKYDFTPEEVQGFLDLYAYDLKKGELQRLKARGINLMAFFFGCLKQGGYNQVHEGFESVEELAEKIKEDGIKLRDQESIQKQKLNELELERKRLEDLEKEIKAKKDSLEEAGINTTKPLPDPKNIREASFNLGMN